MSDDVSNPESAGPGGASSDGASGSLLTSGARGSSKDKIRRRFPGISSRAYEHPADRAALVALRAVPGIDVVLRKLLGFLGDRNLRLIYLGSSVRVTPYQFKKVHDIYQECLQILDMPYTPELYIAQTPFVNAGAVGIDRPFIVLNSASLILFDEDELRVILGHELGHILSGHVLYKTMLHTLLRLSFAVAGIPVAIWTLMAIIGALKEWDRKSELSCDRAGLLVSQDLETCYRVQMKMAGGGMIGEMNIKAFIEQAREYEEGGDVVDSVIKLLNIVDRSHPFPVLRLAELQRWADSGEYQKILHGDYARRSEDAATSIADEMLASARSYKERMEDSMDPLTSFVRDVGSSVSNKGKGLWERFRGEKES